VEAVESPPRNHSWATWTLQDVSRYDFCVSVAVLLSSKKLQQVADAIPSKLSKAHKTPENLDMKVQTVDGACGSGEEAPDGQGNVKTLAEMLQHFNHPKHTAGPL